MKLSKERYLELTAGMVRGIVTLQHLVDALEQKCPKAVQWPEVIYTVGNMGCVVMIWSHNILTIKLINDGVGRTTIMA